MFGRLISPMASFRQSQEMVIPEERGRIVRANFFADKPMLPEEAKLELVLSGKNFLMFKNADTGEANVLYKREDGDYGLIEPNF